MELITRVVFILFFSLLFFSAAHAARTNVLKNDFSEGIYFPKDSIQINVLGSISRTDFEKRLGRKLGLFERIALKRNQKKIRKKLNWFMDEREIPMEASLTAVFSFTGLFITTLSIVSAFKKNDADVGINGGKVGLVPILIGGILGVVAKRKINKNKDKYKGKGLANAGIIIAGLFLLFAILI